LLALKKNKKKRKKKPPFSIISTSNLSIMNCALEKEKGKKVGWVT
jgi:hypothetical protein